MSSSSGCTQPRRTVEYGRPISPAAHARAAVGKSQTCLYPHHRTQDMQELRSPAPCKSASAQMNQEMPPPSPHLPQVNARRISPSVMPSPLARHHQLTSTAADTAHCSPPRHDPAPGAGCLQGPPRITVQTQLLHCTGSPQERTVFHVAYPPLRSLVSGDAREVCGTSDERDLRSAIRRSN